MGLYDTLLMGLYDTFPLLYLHSPAQVSLLTAVHAHIWSLELLNADREVSSLRQIWEYNNSAHLMVKERDLV